MEAHQQRKVFDFTHKVHEGTQRKSAKFSDFISAHQRENIYYTTHLIRSFGSSLQTWISKNAVFRLHAQKNVKNMLPTMLAVRNVLKLVENVLKYVRSLLLVNSDRAHL